MRTIYRSTTDHAVFFSVVGIDKALFGRHYKYVFNQDFAYFQVMLMAWTGILAFGLGYGKWATRSTVFPQDQIDIFRSQLEMFRFLPFVLCMLAGVGLFAHLVTLPLGEGIWSILKNGSKWATYLAFLLWVFKRNPATTLTLFLLGAIFFRFQLEEVTRNRAQTLIPLVGLLAIYNIVRWIGSSARRPRNTRSNPRDWLVFAILVFLVVAAFAVLSQMRFDMRDVHSLGDYYGFVLGFFFNGQLVKISLNNYP